jgi:hypothetical protein
MSDRQRSLPGAGLAALTASLCAAGFEDDDEDENENENENEAPCEYPPI